MLPKEFKFSPIVTICAVLLAGLMLWASKWQWRRYHEKTEMVSSYTLQSRVAPVPFPPARDQTAAAGMEHLPGTARDLEGASQAALEVINKKIALRGQYDLDRQLIVINRETIDGPGFWLLAPFKLEGSSGAVLVSRGFIPFEDDTPMKWRKYDVPGVQEIIGVAQQSVKQRFSFGPSNPETGLDRPFQTRWLFPEVSKISQQLPYPIVTEFFVQKLGSGPSGGFPKEDVRVEVPPSTHFWYTFEWIGLAIATLLLAFFYQAFWPRRRPGRYALPATANPTLNGRPKSASTGLNLMLLFVLVQSAGPAWATTEPGKVPDQAQVLEQFGQSIDLKIKLKNADGQPVELGDMLIPGRPLVLVPVYFHCPNLCGLLQGGVVDAINRTDLMLGGDYSVVSFSIDPEETTENALARRSQFLGRLNAPTEKMRQNWQFVTGDRDNITKLVRQIGFRYQPDDKEFIHAAILVILSPEGRVSRYFYGIEFEPSDFKKGLVEASAGKIGSAIDRILMFCFHFDSNQGKYTLAIMKIVRIICLAFVLTLVGSIIYLKKTEKKSR